MSEKLEPQNTTQTEGQENAPKDPSKLTFESAFTRRRILAAYWLVILLAIPLWWRYTSISRLSLPESRIQSLAAGQVRHTWIYLICFTSLCELIHLDNASSGTPISVYMSSQT